MRRFLRLFAFLFCAWQGTQAQSQVNLLENQFPPSNATGVARNTAIVLRFATTFAFNYSQVTLRQAGTEIRLVVESSWTDETSLEVILRPAAPLAPSTVYTVAVATPVLPPYQFNFTTGSDNDSVGPRLLSISPDPNSGGADPFGPFVFRFDEPLLQWWSISPQITDGVGYGVADRLKIRFSPDRRALEIRPIFQYRIPSIVEVRFDPAKVRDLAGNSASGAPILARFVATTTGGPRLLGQFPDSGEANLPTNSVVQLLFDRAIHAPSAERGIVLTAAGQAVKLAPRVTGPVVILGGVTLLPNTAYQVKITSELLDANGVALERSAEFGFSTGSGPAPEPTEVTAVGPSVPLAPVNTRIVIKSARRLPSFAPLLYGELTPPQSGGAGYQAIKTSAELLEDRRTLVITPADPLPPWRGFGVDFTLLADFTGQNAAPGGLTFRTNEDRDDDPPRVLASTPSDRATDVPPSTAIKIRLSEAVGLMTRPDSVRLLKDGQRWDGQVVFSDASIEFRPTRALDPGSDYTLELLGVADIVGNTMPRWSIAFRTVGDSTPPRDFPRVLSSSFESGDPGPLDAIELRYSLPLRAGHTDALVRIFVSRPFDSPLAFNHPVRVETSGDTIRIIPTLAWPSGQDVNLNVSTQDLWGRSAQYSATFRAGPGTDNTRPEVVSITPPPGSAIIPGQTIKLVFSEPIRDFQTNGALVALQSGYNPAFGFYWSEDRQSVTIVTMPVNTSEGLLDTPIVIVASAGLADLAGNPLKPLVALFPVLTSRISSGRLPRILGRWPLRSNDPRLDLREPLTLLFSEPVDPAALNRSLWVATSLGRTPGSWKASADGRFAIFQPLGLWPASDTVTLFQTEAVIDATYIFSVATAAAASPILTVLRTSFFAGVHPANAVIDVEFDRDIATGVSPVTLFANISNSNRDVPFDESQPRPRVRRLTPRAPLTVGSYITILPRPGVNIGGLSAGTIAGARVEAPLPATSAIQLRYRSPLPGSEAVPINAHISLVFSDLLNGVSVTETTARVRSGERTILTRYLIEGPSLTIIPLELLPPAQTVEVRIEGVDDRLGRPVAPIVWSFVTGSAGDLTPPKMLYSNVPASSPSLGLDAQSPVRREFAEPLDPAAIQREFPTNNALNAAWDLSSDLRTITLRPLVSWRSGEASRFSGNDCDWSGNCASIVGNEFTAGFESDRSPLVLRAISPPDGQTAVPLNVKFSLLFNKPVASEALRSLRLIRNGERVPLGAAVSALDGRLSFAPAFPLEPNTSYQLIVEGVRDSSGNTLAGTQSIRFTTGEQFDTVPPSSTFRFVSRTAPLRVRFSEVVDRTTILTATSLLTWIDSRGGGGYFRVEPVTADWSEDRRELTLTPGRELQAGVDYTLDVGPISDLAGLRSLSASFRFQPVENPDTSAVRVSILPEDGSTNAPTNVVMRVQFSRTIDTPPVRLYENDRLVATTLSRSFNGLILARTLIPGQRYRIEVDGFRDDFDNEIPALSSSFTTGSTTDGAALQFVSSNPANAEAGVAPETPWRLTFNKPLSPIVFFDFGPQSSRAIPYRYTTETSREQLTIRPSPAWPAASNIQLTIFPTTRFGPPSVTDWADNRLRQQVLLSFRTAAINDPEPPVLESVTPAPGTPIPGDFATLELRFSKPVTIGSGGLQIFYGATRADSVGLSTPDLRTFRYALRPPANSRVTVVGTDAIRDNADNPMAPFVLEYPTGENLPFGPPVPELVEPRGGDVPATATILVRFDRVMESGSIMQSFRVTQDGVNVRGSIDILEGGRAYRFRPDAPFPAGATVRVFVLPTAVDPSGWAVRENPNPMGLFVIAGTLRTVSVSRRGFGETAPADAVLEVEFNSELSISSVHDDSVWLRRGGELVRGRASLRDGNVLQFTPDFPLEPGVEYVLTAGAALHAVDGLEFAGQDLRFRAVAPEENAQVESVDAVQWQGRPTLRVRFTGALSPLAARGFRLERDGRTEETETLTSTDHREVWLIPRQPAGSGALTVAMEGVPGRNGRELSRRRLTLAPKEQR